MPPLINWFRGRRAIADFLRAAPFQVDWRHRPIRLNGQLAVGCYAPDATGTHAAYALDVLQVRDGHIAAITSFIDGSRFAAYGMASQVPS